MSHCDGLTHVCGSVVFFRMPVYHYDAGGADSTSYDSSGADTSSSYDPGSSYEAGSSSASYDAGSSSSYDSGGERNMARSSSTVKADGQECATPMREVEFPLAHKGVEPSIEGGATCSNVTQELWPLRP